MGHWSYSCCLYLKYLFWSLSVYFRNFSVYVLSVVPTEADCILMCKVSVTFHWLLTLFLLRTVSHKVHATCKQKYSMHLSYSQKRDPVNSWVHMNTNITDTMCRFFMHKYFKQSNFGRRKSAILDKEKKWQKDLRDTNPTESGEKKKKKSCSRGNSQPRSRCNSHT